MSGLFTLTLLTAVPAIGAVLVAGLPRAPAGLARCLALAVSVVALVGAVGLAGRFDPAVGSIQLSERHPWVPSLGVDYFVGVDGLGLMMVLLTAVVVPWSLWLAEPGRPPLYHALVLALEAGLFGTFTALNFFHWFIFWELSLIPAFFLVKLWGGPARSAAAVQFFLYTMVGSVTMLLGFLALHRATGTFDFLQLASLAQSGGMPGGRLGMWIFAGIFLGLAVKIPVMPFHTWLPSTYAEAPSAVTVLLTGLMSKMGVYGLLRIAVPLFPEAMRALLPVLLGLAVLTIVAAAGAACAQRDLKRLLAYSSVNHLGYCLLGIVAVLQSGDGVVQAGLERAAALNGVVLQMVNHGITAAALFGFVALLERRSGGVSGLDAFGGLGRVVPVFTGLMGVALFASLGLPGLNGFVGEFLIFKGSFPLAPWATAAAALGLLLTAVFLLTLIQRVFAGPLNPAWSAMPDLGWREWLPAAPLLVLMLVLGVLPQLAVGAFNATVMHWLKEWRL